MNLEGAIFDLDGTLLDSMHIWRSVGEDYLISVGKVPTPDIREILKPLSLREASEYVRTTYDIPLTAEQIGDGINALMEEKYRSFIPLKATALEFLQKLKSAGVRMCIATATARHLVEMALSRLGIAHFFLGLTTCTEVGRGKDQPDIYFKALDILGTEKDRTVIFEDALYAIRTAKKAGFFVAGVLDAHEGNDQNEVAKTADWYLKDFTEWEMSAL
jgi:HAD superfamily hydrolase (TIGR01509 family)